MAYSELRFNITKLKLENNAKFTVGFEENKKEFYDDFFLVNIII
jgi:hypothetical protein